MLRGTHQSGKTTKESKGMCGGFCLPKPIYPFSYDNRVVLEHMDVQMDCISHPPTSAQVKYSHVTEVLLTEPK